MDNDGSIAMNNIAVWGFRSVPQFAQGLVRDLRVRWALQEAGVSYEVRQVSLEDRTAADHRRRQPFGMVPAVEVDGRPSFESGAIVHQIALQSEALMPADPQARADVVTWLFAALNTVEPPVQALLDIDFQHSAEPWAQLRRPAAVDLVNARLSVLASWLDGRDYLLDRFSAADILMTTVLRLIRHTELVAGFAVLAAYVERCEARPAFQKALAEQLADYNEAAALAA
jgi:glutathione S-transferase